VGRFREEASMRLTKFFHSCLRLEHDDAVLVIDPGTLSEREALDGVDAVLITHEHFDHLDVEALADALGKRPSVAIYTHPDVVPKMGDLAGVVNTVVAGDEFTAAGFRVRAYGGLHAIIHPDIPRVANLGFYLEDARLYHPGDSLHVPEQGVETLLVPVAAPWLKLHEAIDFVQAIRPKRSIGIHNAQLNERGLASVNSWLGRETDNYQYLAPGESPR